MYLIRCKKDFMSEITLLIGAITTALTGLIAAYFNAKSKQRVDVITNVTDTLSDISELHTKEISELRAIIERYQNQLAEKDNVILEQDKIIARFKIEILEYKNEISKYRLESAGIINDLKEQLLQQTKENGLLNIKVAELTDRVKYLESVEPHKSH